MTLDELNAFKAALALEREERVAEDDEIVQVRLSAYLLDWTHAHSCTGECTAQQAT